MRDENRIIYTLLISMLFKMFNEKLRKANITQKTNSGNAGSPVIKMIVVLDSYAAESDNCSNVFNKII